MQADEYVVHPLRIARVELGLTQEEMAQEIGLGVSTIRRAEQWFPLNIKTQRILSDYFKKTPKELCLLGRGWTQGDGKAITPQQTAPRPAQRLPAVNAPVPPSRIAAPSPQYAPVQAIDLLVAQPNIVTDRARGRVARAGNQPSRPTLRGRLVTRKHPELSARSDAGRAGHVRHYKAQVAATERRGNSKRHCSSNE